MTSAIYPGTFDPITNGHVDVVERSSKLFDEVVVAVFAHPEKKMLFSTRERVEMAQKALANLPNVRVDSYKGLTVDFARQVGARVIIRGLRAVSDFELEFQMALANKKLAPDIEVLCLITSLAYSFLSSSIIKQVAQYGGDVSRLVPPHVAEALEAAYRR